MRIKTILILIFIIGYISIRIVTSGIYTHLRSPYYGFARAFKIVEIKLGTPTEQVIKHLVREGILPGRRGFKLLLLLSPPSRFIKAGEYKFDSGLSPLKVYQKLTLGEVFYHPLTIPEGKDLWDIAELVERGGFCSQSDFLQAARQKGLVQRWDPQAEDLEGYLYPDTYMLTKGVKPSTIVEMMVRRFKEVFNEELREECVQMGFSVRQIVTLASMIEKETSIPKEKPIISAIFHNRLRRGMLLQCDPTLIYALKMEGLYQGNIRKRDFEFDSPYNTYRYQGLPPGPIANSGRDSLIAALHPADSDYLYFVSKKNGEHHFSRTLMEHRKAVIRYQKVSPRTGNRGVGSKPPTSPPASGFINFSREER